MTQDLHAPGTLLGLYWMLFGIGALRQLPLWPVTVVIVVAWGLALRGDGSTDDCTAHLNGYTVIQADDLDQVLSLVRLHPYLGGLVMSTP